MKVKYPYIQYEKTGYTPVFPAAQLTRAPVRHSSLQSPGQRGTELGPAAAAPLVSALPSAELRQGWTLDTRLPQFGH